MNVFEILKAKIKAKLHEPSYQHTGEDYYTGLCDAEGIILDVEQEYNNGWIPCSERLPIYNDEYNVTVGVASEFGYYETVTTLRFARVIGEYEKWVIPNGMAYEVIAWQPLPEIYREV